VNRHDGFGCRFVIDDKEVENMSKNDGGPAFPCGGWLNHDGMSLRDYLAATALQGMMASESEGNGLCPRCSTAGKFIDGCAKEAYAYADAMLKEREVKP